MNVFDYLEKHGELENATAALEYFADTRGRGGMRHIDIDRGIFKCYRLVFGNTTGRTGQYHPRKMQIELHEGLLVEGREDQHKQTLLHEVAHLIQRHIWESTLGQRVKSHGVEWKMVMRKLGVPATRATSYDWMKEHRESKAKLIYACKKCGTEIPAQKLRRKLLQMGVTHKRCGGSFYLKEDRRGTRVKTYTETPKIDTIQAAEAFVGKKPSKPVIGQVYIKKAKYRNRWVKEGMYDVVRGFKYKKHDFFTGTISILIKGTVFRVTTRPDWFVE